MSAIDPNDNELPPGGTDATQGDELGHFTALKKKIIRGQAARKDWRKEAVRAFDFVANKQWSEDDKRQLESQNRPAVTFNRVAPIIKAVCGLEVNNRQTVAFLPREEGDSGTDEALTATAKWMQDECQALDEESEAFRDLAICGEGWTESIIDFDDDLKGKFVELRIDPLEMGVFEGATRQNYVDARGIYRIRDMAPDDAVDLFDGKYTVDQLHAGWIDNPGSDMQDGGMGNKLDYPDKTRDSLEPTLGQGRRVRIVQIQYWVKQNVHLVAQHGSDQLQEMSDDDFSTYQARVAQISATSPESAPTYEHAQVKRKKYFEVFLGAQILHEEAIAMNEFKFKAMTGDRDRTERCFYGMLRDMFDPQMWANKWLSQTMHIMNSNAKGGIIAETDAFVDTKRAEMDWADNTKIIWVKPGSLVKKKVQDRNPPPMPQGLSELMQFALSSLRDVTGVNLELLGQADREQAASLEAQRRQSAMTILATLFNSLRKYRVNQGRLMLHFIQLIPDGTLARVLQDGKTKYIPLMKSKPVECYDVIIDEAPASPDQKLMIWGLTTQLLQQGIPLSPPTIIALLKYSPYPESVVAEIAASMGLNGQQNPQQLQQQLQQAEAAIHVLTTKLQQAMQAQQATQNQEAIKLMELEIAEYKARTDRINAELVFAAAEKRNEATLNGAAIQALAPQPGPSDGEGTTNTGGGVDPDLMNALMSHMTDVKSMMQQMMNPQPQTNPTPAPGAAPQQEPVTQ